MNELLREPVDRGVGTGRQRVEVRAEWVGRDLLVTIGGGTVPHIGAVALGQPRPSLRADGSISATVSVLTLLGHKEDDLARWAAHQLASSLNVTVVVTAGLHVDRASPEEIERLSTAARALVSELTSNRDWHVADEHKGH